MKRIYIAYALVFSRIHHYQVYWSNKPATWLYCDHSPHRCVSGWASGQWIFNGQNCLYYKRLSLVQCVHTTGDATCYTLPTHCQHFRTIFVCIYYFCSCDILKCDQLSMLCQYMRLKYKQLTTERICTARWNLFKNLAWNLICKNNRKYFSPYRTINRD